MRSLIRDCQKIWFVKSDTTVPEGRIDTQITYSAPILKMLRVTYTNGEIYQTAGGWSYRYDRVAILYDRDFKPEEGDYAFVDVEPVLDMNGNLKRDVNGYYITHPDYIVNAVMDSQRSTVSRIGLRKIRRVNG